MSDELRKYTVTQPGVFLKGAKDTNDDLEVGAEVELTERQATVNFVNKVTPVVEPEEVVEETTPEEDTSDTAEDAEEEEEEE